MVLEREWKYINLREADKICSKTLNKEKKKIVTERINNVALKSNPCEF